MVLVGRVLTATHFAESRLYAADFSHRYRKAKVSKQISKKVGKKVGKKPATREVRG